MSCCFGRHNYNPHPYKDGFVCTDCGQCAVEVKGEKVEVLTLPEYASGDRLRRLERRALNLLNDSTAAAIASRIVADTRRAGKL